MRQVKRTQVFKQSAAHSRDEFGRLPFFASIDLSGQKAQALTLPSDDEEQDILSKEGARSLHLDFWSFVAKEARSIQFGFTL